MYNPMFFTGLTSLVDQDMWSLDVSNDVWGMFHTSRSGSQLNLSKSVSHAVFAPNIDTVIRASITGTTGDDNLVGTSGDDIFFPLAGKDTIDGSDGFDIVSYANLGVSIYVSAENTGGLFGVYIGESRSVEQRTNLSNIEGIIGTDFDDLLVTNVLDGASDLYFDGNGGDDFISTGAGNDTLIGGDGDDFMRGRDGIDSYDGGAGVDRVSLFDSRPNRMTQAVVVDLRSGIITNDGYGNTETITNVEKISVGSIFADTLHGDDQNNELLGTGAGADNIYGHGGDDLLYLSEAGGVIDGGYTLSGS